MIMALLPGDGAQSPLGPFSNSKPQLRDFIMHGYEEKCPAQRVKMTGGHPMQASVL